MTTAGKLLLLSLYILFMLSPLILVIIEIIKENIQIALEKRNNITTEDFAKVVENQLNKIIKKTNKKLLRSLKRKPYGYAKTKVWVESTDMMESIISYYQKAGYKVNAFKDFRHWWNIDKREHCITIEIKNWSK